MSSSSSSAGQPWLFRGVARRLDGSVATVGEVPTAVIEVEEDVFHDVPSEAVAATALDVEKMQTVAASWLEDQQIDRNLHEDIDTFIVNATIALTGGNYKLCSAAGEISSDWNRLNRHIQAARDADASQLQIEAFEKMLLEDSEESTDGAVDDDTEKIDKDDIKSGGLEVKQEEGNGIKRRRITKKTSGSAKIAEE